MIEPRTHFGDDFAFCGRGYTADNGQLMVADPGLVTCIRCRRHLITMGRLTMHQPIEATNPDEIAEALSDHDLGYRLRRITRLPKPYPREVRNALLNEAARRLITYNGPSPLAVLSPTATHVATNPSKESS